ncbi:hypothetical protein [Actinomadura oligospora]|uniref:hypothetical protein n=1 Tax=Actinomadura oligospora TaxID=111804 RepID=UPI000478AFF4|nr:hypothetical protein [Actinomadura oligospora]
MTKTKYLARTRTAVMLSGLTLGALTAVAPLAHATTDPTSTTTAVQEHSDRGYAKGYRDGYRKGYRDANRDAHKDCRYRKHAQARQGGEYNRGYADGYARGYDKRYNEICQRTPR